MTNCRPGAPHMKPDCSDKELGDVASEGSRVTPILKARRYWTEDICVACITSGIGGNPKLLQLFGTF